MATVYIDSSEAKKDTPAKDGKPARRGTLLVNAESYISVSNLEHYTGGDILVSPWPDLPSPLKRNFPPHRIILSRHCWNGCLIQRKSGHDLLGSITHLDHILYRMSQWCQNPWLVYTNVRQSRGGMAVVTGSRRKSRWKWDSVGAKLDAWRDRGGSIKSLPGDDDLPDWLESRCRAVDKWQENPEKLIGSKIPQQPITVRSEDQNYFNTLRWVPPGVGEKTVENLIKYVATEKGLPPTLWVVEQFACSLDSLNVSGWGRKSMERMREWTGCDGTIYYDGVLLKLGDVMIGDLVAMKEKEK